MASFNSILRTSFRALVFILLFSACTRIGTSELGLGLLPSMDYINTKDTIIEVETETNDLPDSLRVYSNDDHILGEINNDPLFGNTKATVFFQLLPNFFPFYIQGNRDSITVDSAVLILKYNGFYGDSSKPLVIKVNQLDASTPFDQTVNYVANYGDQYGLKIGATMANPYKLDFAKANDSIYTRYEAAKSQIRIKLFDKLATQLIKGYDSNNAYRSDTTFRQAFPGIALTIDPSSNNNVLLRLNLTDTNTKLALYFKTNYVPLGVTGSVDTTVVHFRFNTSFYSSHANFIKRDRSSAEITKHLNKSNDSLVYIQTSPGTGVKIKVPALKNFANKIIHRAELIAEQVPDETRISTTETQMLPPRYLFLGAIDSPKTVLRNIPSDYEGVANTDMFKRFGGFLTYKTLNGFDKVAAYNFNITRYVQGVISRKDTLFNMRLLAPVNDSISYVPPYPNNTYATPDYFSTSTSNQPANGRVRLGGGKHSKFKMRLHIYYSDL
jgi:hypothetical protein